MYKKLLVPTDGSQLSNQTIGSAIAFAREIGAAITFFYAAPDILATGDGAGLRSIAPTLLSETIAGDAHPVLLKAEAAARAAGVPHASLFKVSDRPHEAIVQAAEEQGCDLIFMASRGPKSIGGLLLGSETLKVLMHAKVPVLVSSVMRNSLTPDMNKALAIIQDEHRSLAAVLHAMRHLRDRAIEQSAPLDFQVFEQLLYYIREFPQKLHHPKENAYLFTLLRKRTHAIDDTLAALEAEHADESLLDQLFAALRKYQAEGSTQEGAFAAALDRFIGAQWQHMSLEEQVVLPAAQVHLLAQDWQEIAHAFGKNGDPRFGAEPDAEFRKLFAKLARMTSQLKPDASA
ncbi:universal stress protein [Thauera sinica]|uniref:Universal stress protein n=1 Tax=Thauera sinica TaxID=2665146 RepID=A0ABW1AXW4_9RHOO|nr:universal stress protein [Thauera sp. K11]ATE58767.1 universal stress protein UspA [Thauera sp. K11]